MADKKIGMTSVEAAALFLSDGKTTDPQLAAVIDENAKNELDMDGLQRAHLRRMMGFNWRTKVAPNKIHVSSTERPFVSTHMKLKDGDIIETPGGFGLTNEAAINRLVEACARLKERYQAALEKQA
jgi:hypothetical protein